jgi:hypothetical protein
MTITYNSDTDVITISSDNLASFANIDTVTLKSKINCEGSEYTVEIEEEDVVGTSYSIVNSSFYSVDELDDGVYSFELIIEYSDDTNDIKEVNCLFINNDTRCDVAEGLAMGWDVDVALAYYILDNATNCACNCEYLCALYKLIDSYEPSECGDCQGC